VISYLADDSQLFWMAMVGDHLAAAEGSSRLFASPTGAKPLHLQVPPGGSEQLASASGFVVLLDGQLHDTRPLTRSLGWSDDRGASDASLVLDAYRCHGTEVFRLLSGEFALLIWDERSGDLVLARDPLGARPLCYGEANNGFYASPSPDLLVASGLPRELNRTAIAERILSRRIEPSETFYARVRRLPPGHVLELRRERSAVSCYLRAEGETRTALREAAEVHGEFDRLLHDATVRALAGRRAAVYLSGGLDSATVAAIAAKESARVGLPPPLALSIQFPDPDGDESSAQRLIANDLALPLRMRTLAQAAGSDGVLITGLRLSERAWFPPLHPWAGAYEALAVEGSQAGCGVLLTGEGGNEVLERSWSEMSALLARGRLADVHRLARGRSDYDRSVTTVGVYHSLLRETARLAIHRVTNPSSRRVILSALGRKRDAHESWALPDRALRSELVEKRGAASVGKGHPPPRGFNPEVPTFLEASHLLAKRLGMLVRSPYYSLELLDLRAQVPLMSTLFGGRYKGLARASYEQRVSGPSRNSLCSTSGTKTFLGLLRAETPVALKYLGGLPNLAHLGIVPSSLARELGSGSPLPELGFYHRWQLLACEAWLGSRERRTT